jgi:hypothetical protein
MLPPLCPGSITTTGRRAGGALVAGAGEVGGDVVGRGTGRVVVGPVVAARGVAAAGEGAGAATGEDGAAAGPGTASEPHPAASRTSPAASERRRPGTARTRTACQFTQRRTRRIGS